MKPQKSRSWLLVEVLKRIDSVAGFVQSKKTGSTVERECLKGSAYRRLAQIRALNGASPNTIIDALKEMRKYYKRASERHQIFNHGEINFYPFTNYLVAATILHLQNGRFKGIESDERDTLEKMKS